MTAFTTQIIQTLSPKADARHGPLPPLLVAMTLVTGLVDAFSYLMLGHVFVANMTGNVVFLGFALAGAPGFSLAASALALGAFWAGALLGGAIGARRGAHRGRLLATTAALEAGLFAVSLALAAIGATPLSAGYRYPLIALLATGLGMQNATARRLAVPDLTTTVLTLTITGTAADASIVGGRGSSGGRRFVSVFSMFAGALIGAVLVLHADIALPLAVALGVLVAVSVGAAVSGRSNPSWTTA